MKHYRYIGTEEQLVSRGFEKLYDSEFTTAYEKDVNVYDENVLYVDKKTKELKVTGYEFGLKHYIQDLIDDGLVEVIE